jgi:predicted phage tail protein
MNSEGAFVRNINNLSLANAEIGVVCMKSEEKKLIEDAASQESISADDLVKVISDPLYLQLGGEFDEIHFVPAMGGKFIFIPTFGLAAVAKAAFYLIMPMLISGIANALFPPVKTTNRTRTTKSYLFEDRPNIREQGGPVPVGYGMLRVGSVTASFSRRNKFLPNSISDITIQSYTSFRLQDIISEGPIAGICDSQGNLARKYQLGNIPSRFDQNEALKGIYINDVKLMNDQGQLNIIPNEKVEGSGGEVQPVYTEGSCSREKITHTIDYEKNAQSPLIGPDQGKSLPSGFDGDVAQSGAAAYTYAITDRNIGMVTLNLSSEGMYHNWTDKRVRRRFIGRSVSVTTGTSEVEVVLAIRIFDGVKYTSPIMVGKDYSPLEDVDQVPATSYTNRYNVSNLIARGHRKIGIPIVSTSATGEFSTASLIKALVWFLFDDPEQEEYGEMVGDFSDRKDSFARRDVLLSIVGSSRSGNVCAAEDFIDKVRIGLNSDIKYAYKDHDKTFSEYLEDYMDGLKRIEGNNLVAKINPEISIAASALASISSRIFATGSELIAFNRQTSETSDIFKDNFHVIMSILKSRVCGFTLSEVNPGNDDDQIEDSLTLGHDGHIYIRSGKIYWKRGKLLESFDASDDRAEEIKNVNESIILDNLSDVNELEEGSFKRNVPTYIFIPEVDDDETTYSNSHRGSRTHNTRGSRNTPTPTAVKEEDFEHGTWVVYGAPEYLGAEDFKRLDSTQREGYQLSDSVERGQAFIKIKGISTSPASIDFNFLLPYMAEGESMTIQIVRTVEEITGTKEQQEKQKRLSLKGIRQHMCLAGEKLRFNGICTSWAEIEFDSVNFQQIPDRNYLAKLKKVAVPSNYDSVNRMYYGAWNGLFKGQLEDDSFYDISETDLEWTDNPAWVLLDILTNRRFGMGKSGLTIDDVDVWNLYAVAKFCDELVETGFPAESPKRKFYTDNLGEHNILPVKGLTRAKTSTWQAQAAAASNFTIQIRDEFDQPIGKKYFQQEFARIIAGENKGSQSSVKGRCIAFYMEDGTLERRTILRTNLETSEIVLRGPSFIDHNSTNSADITTGSCLLEKSYAMVEPRFSMNTLFDKQEDAIDVVRDITASFRTVVNYMNGQISFSPEQPQEPTMLFNDANVDKDGFSYAGASKTSRITVAKVRYVDHYDNFKSKVEYYEDPAGIEKFGYKEQDILAIGCSSKGQAQRLARFMVIAPLLESEVVSFKTGIEGAMLYPGAIVEISDSRRFGKNINGRIKDKSADERKIMIDKIISNISFYDPVAETDNDRVEIAVVVSRGFEQIGRRGPTEVGQMNYTGLYKKMRELAASPNEFDEDAQMALIEGTKRSQIMYFDGEVSANRREIVRLKRKYKFSIKENSSIVRNYDHGLKDGDEISFLTFGVLPEIARKDGDPMVNAVGTAGSASYIPPVLSRKITAQDVFAVRDATKSDHVFDVVLKSGSIYIEVEFLNQGFVTTDETVSGGEHFYTLSSGDFQDTIDSINEVGVGVAWSIRGYRREFISEMINRTENLEKVLNALVAEAVPNKTARYYNQILGDFTIVNFMYSEDSNGNINQDAYVDINQDGNAGKGLGLLRIFLKTWGAGEKELLNISGLGSMFFENNGHTIYINHGSTATSIGHFFRPDKNSDILMLAGNNFGNDFVHMAGDQFRIVKKLVSLDGTTNLEERSFISLSMTNPNNSKQEADFDAEIVSAIASWTKLNSPIDPLSSSPVTLSLNLNDAANINDYRNVGRRQYRVSSISEDNGVYDIKGSEYNKEKFTIIEKKLSLNRPTLPIPPQANMSIPLAPSEIEIKDLTIRS